ncbi:hypothetical protein [Marinibacterium profundimaris]|uniref:Uncharacterized protein n=1 Tax=Marinibacterium profundimaris TaxID=1679460 RepID=A0A225NRR2_9RHOB|nr:hypothetical protein [Marinibacterium profundimaris]OWU77621.1 hypothetical protein ATO3_02765 [Marinibacterium profundimaris]
MTEASRDTRRAMAAIREILDGRDPVRDRPQVLITLDHVVSALLLAAMEQDHRKAVAMLNEGTVPHVEERIALHASRTGDRK